MDRYGKITRQIEYLSQEFNLKHIITTLRPRPFVDSLFMEAKKTMENLRGESCSIHASDGYVGVLQEVAGGRERDQKEWKKLVVESNKGNGSRPKDLS